MARRNDKSNETENPTGNTLPPDNADSVATSESESTAAMDKLSEPEDAGVIHPVAFEIKLKSIHPHATYGRCGYRFNKETVVEIPFEALTGEQIATLADDPYLEFVPVVEGENEGDA